VKEDFTTEPITSAEVRLAVNKMKPDDAAGIDGLTTMITALLNKFTVLGGDPDAQVPEAWRTSIIISIPKMAPQPLSIIKGALHLNARWPNSSISS
jgi:hypothetical protein